MNKKIPKDSVVLNPTYYFCEDKSFDLNTWSEKKMGGHDALSN